MTGITPKPRVDVEIVVESRCFCCSGFVRSPKKELHKEPTVSERVTQIYEDCKNKGTPDTERSF